MQGINKNKKQFSLLVLVNAFVGSMVGLERAVLPGLASSSFGINEELAILSFIIAFGGSKALSNLSVAKLAEKFSRKQILLLGWIFGLPVPLMLMYANSWNWIILANVLLGLNQGLAWSATVIMKIDLAGNKNRGLAMGINEFAGYLAVGLASYLSGYIASSYGLSFYPFLPGIFIALFGFIISLLFVKDTASFVTYESALSKLSLFKNVWKSTTVENKNISSVTWNGIINNMNDAVVWGLLPILLAVKGFSIKQLGVIVAVYPVVWGIAQIFTGRMGDIYCKKQIISAGMILQAIAIFFLVTFSNFYFLIAASAILGFGTAMVYPNFLSVVAESTHPAQRAQSLSIFRFWRDSGYVIGALLAGTLAYFSGLANAIIFIAVLTAWGGVQAHFRMCCTNKKFWKSEDCPLVPVY